MDQQENQVMNGRVCTACGAPLAEGQAFCAACGQPQEAPKAEVCANCGAPLAEGQAFCSACGQPKAAPQADVCSNCGAELAADQEFCVKCGQKKGLTVDANVSSAINQFNQTVATAQKKPRKKIGLIAAIVAVVLVVAVVLSSSGSSLGSKYDYVSADSDLSYSFEDGKYTYRSDSSYETGDYEVEKDKVTMTDEDGDDTVYKIKGDYLYSADGYFDQKFDATGPVNKTISKEASFTYKGSEVTLTTTVKFKSNGSYSFESVMSLGSYSSTLLEHSGKYEIDGYKIYLTPSGEDTLTYLIVNEKVYNVVYKKVK